MKAATTWSEPSLFPVDSVERPKVSLQGLLAELSAFDQFGTKTQLGALNDGEELIPVFINEFWTSKQRAASSLHEISYRACFKPQLPRFFIERLTRPGGVVYDPFLGRGTSVIEAALLGRAVAGCDVNPLSVILTKPRLHPPTLNDVRQRLAELDWNYDGAIDEELLAFYHRDTLGEICALRHFLASEVAHAQTEVDAWIRMVATNRLTGHSAGFFSVYTLPPNQAVSAARQRRINILRSQIPPRRSVPELITRKTQTLLRGVSNSDRNLLNKAAAAAVFITGSCENTPRLETESVDLIITSPPFLNVVDYAGDNWLRCWFNGIDETKMGIRSLRKSEEWVAQMTRVFKELERVLSKGGYIAFEVGEVRRGKLKMEELVIPAAKAAGLQPVLVLINAQEFTKTSNCWGVTNQISGTNTNRVVLLRKAR
jgi:DNA modification methylase